MKSRLIKNGFFLCGRDLTQKRAPRTRNRLHCPSKENESQRTVMAFIAATSSLGYRVECLSTYLVNRFEQRA